MRFGEKVRTLRKAKNLGQRALAEAVGVSFTYISKIENHRLDFGEFPSEDVIRKIAAALEADPHDLLILARKIPEAIRRRVLERPDAFRRLSELDDRALDLVLAQIVDGGSGGAEPDLGRGGRRAKKRSGRRAATGTSKASSKPCGQPVITPPGTSSGCATGTAPSRT